MRTLSALAAAIAVVAVTTPAAHAAKVTKLRITGAPSWQQWIERDTLGQDHLGVWFQRACSPQEPRISYTLARTSEPAGSTMPTRVIYTGFVVPLSGGKAAGGGQAHEEALGPVSEPLHDAFYGQAGRDPDSSQINHIGSALLSANVATDQPTDLLLNWRVVRYRGISKPAGACAEASLPTYNVLAKPPVSPAA